MCEAVKVVSFRNNAQITEDHYPHPTMHHLRSRARFRDPQLGVHLKGQRKT